MLEKDDFKNAGINNYITSRIWNFPIRASLNPLVTFLPRRFFFSVCLILAAGFFHAAKSQPSNNSTDSITAPSQAPSGSSVDRRELPGPVDFITNLPRDWRDWAIDNIQLRYWPQISLIAASTAIMIVYDNQMWKPFEKEYDRNNSFHTASDLFVDIGDGRFQFGLSAAYLGYGIIAGDKRAIRTASQITEVILASGGVVQLLKHLTGRESPIDITTNPTGRWDFFPNQIDYLNHTSHYDAFPSGHLTTALATLTVIANNYPEQKWILPVGYAACAGLAVGLVAQSIHWWSDYPLAIALGIGFGNLVSPNPNGDVSVSETSKKKDTGSLDIISKLLSQTTIAPTYVPYGAGIGMTLRF